MKRFRTLLQFGILLVASAVHAHEGHAPLPTKGVEVDVEQGTILLTKESLDALGLQTAEVQTTLDQQHVLAYARLVPAWQRNAVVATQIPGRIVRLSVQPGEWRNIGEPLAEMESSQLESLQSDLTRASLAVNLSEKLLAHWSELAGESIEAGQLQEATAKHSENVNALAIARLKLTNLGLTDDQLSQLENQNVSQSIPTLTLTSPISGRVHHSDLTIGKVLVPGEHLFEVQDLSTIWCRIEMLEHDFHRVQIGQKVDIQINSLPNRTIGGQIAVIEPSLDATTHLGTAWVDLQNDHRESPELLPGMFGQAKVFVNQSAELLTVPASSVARDGAERFVLVQQEWTDKSAQFIKRNIVVVRQSNDVVQFRSSDLFPGDLVVTTGANPLFNFFVQSVLHLSTEARQNIALRVERASMRPIEEVFAANGIVELPPEKRDAVSVQVSGVLASIAIDRGQKVRAGDVLVELASLEFQDLQLQLINAHVSMENLRTTWQRLQRLTTQNIRSRRQFWEVENQLQVLLSQFDSLRRKLQTIGLSNEQIENAIANRQPIDRLSVRATIDGNVIGMRKRLGETVQSGEPILDIHQTDSAWIRSFVNEPDIARTKIGQSARVRWISDPNAILSATLVRQSQTVNPDNRTLSVWLELAEEPPFALAHNMLSRVDFVVDVGPSVLAVPREAIVADGTRRYLFVQMDDDRFERRWVKTGRADDRFIEIQSGLQVGELVAVWGTTELQTAYAALR